MKPLLLPSTLAVLSLGVLTASCGPGGGGDGAVVSDAALDGPTDAIVGEGMRCSMPEAGVMCAPCVDSTGMPNGCMACFNATGGLEVLCA